MTLAMCNKAQAASRWRVACETCVACEACVACETHAAACDAHLCLTCEAHAARMLRVALVCDKARAAAVAWR